VRRLALWPAVLGGALLGALAVGADTNSTLDSLFGAHAPYEKFLEVLKAEINAQDWSAIADQVAYPLTVKVSGRRLHLDSRNQFLAQVKLILTPKVRLAIEAQHYDALFANANGVMIGNGELWYAGICSNTNCGNPSIKIIAINP
jgi:hypothetical protein